MHRAGLCDRALRGRSRVIRGNEKREEKEITKELRKEIGREIREEITGRKTDKRTKKGFSRQLLQMKGYFNVVNYSQDVSAARELDIDRALCALPSQERQIVDTE